MVSRFMFRKYSSLLIASLALLAISQFSKAEGLYQLDSDLNQPLTSTSNLFVHVANAGDIIRVHLCRQDGAANPVKVDIHETFINSDGVYTKETAILDTLNSSQGNIDCADDMLNPLPKTPAAGELMEYAVSAPGIYGISLDDSTSIHYDRWDISIISASTPEASLDPTATDGNLFSYRWRIETTGSGAKSAATSAEVYTLVPGGFSNTNYVWQIDFNEFAGSGYQLIANNIGAAAPNSGQSTTISGVSVAPLYPVYLSYPTGASP